MKAVHFGAGNIGRGFIGLLYFESNYTTTFIDVNAEVIDALNKQKGYQVSYASDDGQVYNVEDVSGINSMESPKAVIDAIKEADIITTAVGPTILPIISTILAEGLRARLETKQPINLIACENMISGSDFLQEKVYEHLTEEEEAAFDALYRFPNAAVDRIVPNQVHENILSVSVEPYYEWVVEDDFIGERPKIQGMTVVKDLQPFIERKLFTVNTGHATAAYIGYYLGHATIAEAMRDERVLRLVHGVLQETSDVLVVLYRFDRDEHDLYVETTLKRFLNSHIHDEVSRVARGPIRKLGSNDRLIRPAKSYIKLKNKLPQHLASVVALVLTYVNEADEEAIILQKMINKNGIAETLMEVSGLREESRFVELVLEKMDDYA